MRCVITNNILPIFIKSQFAENPVSTELMTALKEKCSIQNRLQVVINVIKSSHRQLALPNWRYVILPIGPIKSLAAYQGSCDTISCLPLCLVNANIIPLILYKQENKIKEWLEKAQKRRSSRRTFIRYVLGIVNNFRFMQTAATAERNESIAIFYHKNFRPKIILS